MQNLWNNVYTLCFFGFLSFSNKTLWGFFFKLSVQDGGRIRRGHHFLRHKFIKRSFECWATSTKQLLNTGAGHQAPRKAVHSLQKEVKVKGTQSCLTLCNPGQNSGVGSLSLLQGIFPTQGSNLGLPHGRQILYQLSHKGSPIKRR